MYWLFDSYHSISTQTIMNTHVQGASHIHVLNTWIWILILTWIYSIWFGRVRQSKKVRYCCMAGQCDVWSGTAVGPRACAVCSGDIHSQAVALTGICTLTVSRIASVPEMHFIRNIWIFPCRSIKVKLIGQKMLMIGYSQLLFCILRTRWIEKLCKRHYY